MVLYFLGFFLQFITVASFVRSALESDESQCVLTVDLRNAFNCVHRSAVLQAASATPLSRYTQWSYGTRSRLCIGENQITSASGV